MATLPPPPTRHVIWFLVYTKFSHFMTLHWKTEQLSCITSKNGLKEYHPYIKQKVTTKTEFMDNKMNGDKNIKWTCNKDDDDAILVTTL